MAITYQGAGTVDSDNGASMTPGLPASWAADDIWILMTSTENASVLAATGWTQIATVYNSADVGGQTLTGTWLWRRAVGGDSAPTVTGATGGCTSRIIGFRGCETSGNPWSTYATANTDANTATATIGTITPGASTDMIVMLIASVHGDDASPAFSGWSGTNPTFTEATEDVGAGGTVYQAIASAYGISTNGSATGSRTATCSDVSFNSFTGLMIALKEPAGGASAPKRALLLGVG